MHTQENLGWTGRIRVTSKYRDGSVEVQEFNNLITNAGRNLLRDALRQPIDAEIKYLAWGSGTTSPTVSDTLLGNEAGRKVVTKQTAGDTGVVVTTVYIAPFEANMQITEIGWFAGSNATTASGSGVMVARVLYNKLKTELESIQIDRTDKIS